METSQHGQAERETLQKFLQIVTHDLNEPLRQIISFSEILQEEELDRLSDEGQLYLQNVVTAGSRMHEMLTGLLELARITSRAQPFELCDLNELLALELDYLEPEIRLIGAQITHEALPQVVGDPNQLRSLLRHILKNAITFIRTGVTLKISIKNTDTPGRVGLSIRDNGIGFEQQYAEIIFQLFQRLNTQEQYPGAGVGLAFCREICNRHGGSISATGEAGEGACFTLELPLPESIATDSENAK